MVASVPEAQKRSRSQAGLTLQISSASASAFSFTQAKFAPSAAWRTTASATSGRACPTSTEPQPMEKSRKAAPVVSSISHPSPRLTTVQSSGGRLNSPLEPAGNTCSERCAARGMFGSVTGESLTSRLVAAAAPLGSRRIC